MVSSPDFKKTDRSPPVMGTNRSPSKSLLAVPQLVLPSSVTPVRTMKPTSSTSSGTLTTTFAP